MSGVNVGTAYLEIVPSAKGFVGKMQSELGGDMAKSGAESGKRFASGFGSSVKKLAGVAAGFFAVDKVVGFLKDANAEARESQKVGALTAQVIKSTGSAANVTADQVGNLAGAISNKVGVDDEAIQSGLNLLLTFKGIRNEVGKGNDIFNQAGQAAVDMAAAMAAASGGELNMRSATTMLGKALNDPAKGITALTRVGVTFTEGQKKQIKALVASGKTMDAQKIILKELRSEFGGAAASQATAADKASVAWGNLKEQIGTAMLPVLDKAATVINEDVIPALSKFITEMQTGKGNGGKFVDSLKMIGSHAKEIGIGLAVATAAWVAYKVALLAVAAAQAVATVAMGVHSAAVAVSTSYIGTLIGVKAIEAAAWVRSAVATVASTAATLAAAAASRAMAAAQWLVNAALTANPIGLVIVGLVALGAALVVAYKKSSTFRAVVSGAFSGVRKAIGWVIGAVAGLMSGFSKMLRALSKVPGFGWARGAADAMQRAADKARRLGNEISSIPGHKDVTINVHEVRRVSQQVVKAAQSVTAGLFGGVRANGGPVTGQRTYLVGERGPELFTPQSSGRIVPNHKLTAAASAGGAGLLSGRVRLVVDGQEFAAYVDDRADGRVGASRSLDAQRRRAQ